VVWYRQSGGCDGKGALLERARDISKAAHRYLNRLYSVGG